MFFSIRAVKTMLAAAVLAAPAVMAGSLQAGNYVIYNRVTDPNGEKLAITFQGDDQYVTMEPLTYSAEQTWTLSLYPLDIELRYTFVPTTSLAQQAAHGTNGVQIFPAGGYIWNVTESAQGWTIQQGAGVLGWGNPGGADGNLVTIEPPTTGATSTSFFWVIESN